MTRASLVTSLILALASQGCVSASVQNGAIIGASSGAAVGAGIGFAASEESLLGASTDERRGDTSLDSGQAILASAAVGAVFGAIIGAMVGRQRERPNDIYIKRAAEQEAAAEKAVADSGLRPHAF